MERLSAKMKENMNTVDNYDVKIKNMEIEDNLVKAAMSDSQGHFSISTPRKRNKDKKRRVTGIDNFDKSAIRGHIITYYGCKKSDCCS